MTQNTGLQRSEGKVLVGLTGRIDSAVAAFLLKKQGFEVIGISLVNVSEDIVSSGQFLPKCHIADLETVRSFCDKIKIPFYASDVKSLFKAEVLDILVSNRLSGKANTSCFNCTRTRIHVLYEKMIQLEADYIATGHYCKVYKNFTSDDYFIHSNNDPHSDQSYLLAGLDNKYLQHLLLPLGELKKNEVKKIAKNFNIGVGESIAQEGFCFKRNDACAKILTNSVPKSLMVEGEVLNIENGVVLGEHQGIVHHYITEKEFMVKGSTPLDKGLEIVSYNSQTNVIEVAGPQKLTFSQSQLVKLRLAHGLDRKKPFNCYVKFKYENKFTKATIFFKNNSTAYLEFDQDIYPLIGGELVAIYDSNGRNSKIIGMGEINRPGEFKLLDRVAEYRSKDDDENVSGTERQLFRF